MTATDRPFSKLPTAPLGTGGPQVGVQGLGCMGMSEFYGPSDTEESLKTLERALELGVTHFDTADIYGSGHNEELVGPFVRANRDQVVIATKFGIVRKADDPAYRGIDNTPGYYAHRRDLNVPIEEAVGAMADLVRQGKVRHLGLSEVTGDELRAAHAVHPIAALQSEWSLFSRDVERTAVPAAAELGVTFVPYSPLGRGFLTGAFTDATELSDGDFRRYQPRFTGDNAARNAELLAPIGEIAAARGVGLAQIALAWVHGQAEVHGLPVVPIPGTRKRSRLEENVTAATLSLTADELTALEPIAARVAGGRYPDMSFTSAARE